MTDADPLVQALAEIVVELAFVLEDAIGDDGEPRTALNTPEWIAFVFGSLGPGQRQRLADVVADITAGADTGPRQAFTESFSFAMGLVEASSDQ